MNTASIVARARASAAGAARVGRYLMARVREPSTHAGIAALLVFLSTVFPERKVMLDALAALFATVAVAKPDATSTATDAPAPALAAEVDKGAQS